MAEISLRTQIEKLVALQKVDTEIYRFKKDLVTKPEAVKKLQEEFESKKARLNSLEERLKKVIVDRKALELDLKQKEESISKANAQLSQIKTNKEYTAKLTEIESIKADKSIAEEKILLSFDNSDSVSKEIEQEKQVVSSQEKEYLSNKKKVEEEIGVIEGKLKTLENERKTMVADIEQVLLQRYEKILQHKDGLAIAEAKAGACGGCFMNINPQTVNSLKLCKELVECQICNRILYIDER